MLSAKSSLQRNDTNSTLAEAISSVVADDSHGTQESFSFSSSRFVVFRFAHESETAKDMCSRRVAQNIHSMFVTEKKKSNFLTRNRYGEFRVHTCRTKIGAGARASFSACYRKKMNSSRQLMFVCVRRALTTESGRSQASRGTEQGSRVERERERERIGSTYLLISGFVRCHSSIAPIAPNPGTHENTVFCVESNGTRVPCHICCRYRVP